ncbi:MAG: hypothetical protein COT38_03170 [Candidatus Omnitrophica bacterium CG08_land_8_20_14_0_20_41_16]|uniref:Glycoside hydrolase family 5 domain-containing protein n=1 Tax=Candidatus Sherwoodlollariibacterium unditelluris TaxID=1974757 RepID=A0A2G9YJU3_9BACT|nr:MAG: hypothetical protein COX41_02985 [Candidatus Omnitrophica bacterium CG23_combo_of_CG06-09_8_20_14_all_41_10]PIS33845.1 MAG: hypothetical protein COT38_03170 [Candidatus Omnitrophica bacterium CG08_land_8_20_14_0_20_41_16]
MITSILNRIRISNFFPFLVLFLSIIVSRLAIAEERAEDSNMNNPFGVLEFLHWNHSWNNYKYASPLDWEKSIERMKEAGVGWVRMDFLWQDIEPEAGAFKFDKYDQIVELLNKNNIYILGILDYSVGWAAACDKWNCPPKDNELFVKYAMKVIQRYKAKIKHWEVWNEPDSSVYWSNQDGLKSYCALLKDVYRAAKKIDPDCKILNGGLANGLASVNRLYDNGAKDYFDILNIHFFESPLHQGTIKAVTVYPKLAYKVMSRNGDANKKIWITEIGCPGVKRGINTDNWWMGKNPTEKQQAGWVKQVYTELLKDKNVGKVFWAFFRDCSGHWDNGVDYFGLVRWDFSRKPSFKAYEKCFQQWRRSGAGGGS